MATTRSKAVSYYYDGEYVSQVRLVCGKVIDEGWCPIRPFNRTPTAQNMNYAFVLKDFYMEWESIEKIIKEDKARWILLN